MDGDCGATEHQVNDGSDDCSSPEHTLQDDIGHRQLDEPWWATKQRETAEKADEKLRAKLGNPKTCRAVYRDIADACDDIDRRLSDAEFRVISYLLRRADPDLSNCFPSQKTAATKTGRSRFTYNRHLVALRAKGWVRTREFHKDGRQSSSLIQFSIPPGVLPLGLPWFGPEDYSKRNWGTPKRQRRPAQ